MLHFFFFSYFKVNPWRPVRATNGICLLVAQLTSHRLLWILYFYGHFNYYDCARCLLEGFFFVPCHLLLCHCWHRWMHNANWHFSCRWTCDIIIWTACQSIEWSKLTLAFDSSFTLHQPIQWINGKTYNVVLN